MMQHSVLDNRKVGSSQPPGKDDAAQIEILKAITADEDKGSPHGEGGTLSDRQSGIAPKSDTQ